MTGKEVIDNMTKALDRGSVKEAFTTQRVQKVAGLWEAVRSGKAGIGTVFSDQRFASSTMGNIKGPKDLSDLSAGQVRFVFDVAKGTKGAYVGPNVGISHHETEAEFLFQRGQKFRIKGITTGEKYQGVVVHVETIPGSRGINKSGPKKQTSSSGSAFKPVTF